MATITRRPQDCSNIQIIFYIVSFSSALRHLDVQYDTILLELPDLVNNHSLHCALLVF